MTQYAWMRYELHTEEDGSIGGTCTTNDNNDDGYPDKQVESWPVHFYNYPEMLKRTGGMHYGCSGIKVSVYLDGHGIQYDGRMAS